MHLRGGGAIMCEVVSRQRCFFEVEQEAKVKRKGLFGTKESKTQE